MAHTASMDYFSVNNPSNFLQRWLESFAHWNCIGKKRKRTKRYRLSHVTCHVSFCTRKYTGRRVLHSLQNAHTWYMMIFVKVITSEASTLFDGISFSPQNASHLLSFPNRYPNRYWWLVTTQVLLTEWHTYYCVKVSSLILILILRAIQ